MFTEILRQAVEKYKQSACIVVSHETLHNLSVALSKLSQVVSSPEEQSQLHNEMIEALERATSLYRIN